MRVYRLNFERQDFERIAQVLASVKGKFSMSLTITRRCGASSKHSRSGARKTQIQRQQRPPQRPQRPRQELLISNY
jgi:hypothetical protein